MSDEDVKRLREYFHTRENDEEEENILSAKEQGSISALEANEALNDLRQDAFIRGRKDFQQETGYCGLLRFQFMKDVLFKIKRIIII